MQFSRLRSYAALCVAGALALGGAAYARIQDAPQDDEAQVRKHLETFDDLDFRVFSNQKWDELKRSHSERIVVYWPDGRVTRGLATHIEDLKKMFVYAPDTRIKEHPIRFGSGEWTCVTGVLEGTFTRPMTTPDGAVIRPTGKRFKLPMCTVGKWKDGVMIEEHLFWDNAAFMQQIGATPP